MAPSTVYALSWNKINAHLLPIILLKTIWKAWQVKSYLFRNHAQVPRLVTHSLEIVMRVANDPTSSKPWSVFRSIHMIIFQPTFIDSFFALLFSCHSCCFSCLPFGNGATIYYSKATHVLRLKVEKKATSMLTRWAWDVLESELCLHCSSASAVTPRHLQLNIG